MHEQIRTSPGSTGDNFRHVVDALGGINIAGIGPDFEPPHIRLFVDHEDDDEGPVHEAMEALEAAHLHPVLCPAVTTWIPDEPGALRARMRQLIRDGYEIESVLILGTRSNDNRVRVSFGVRERVANDWLSKSLALADELQDLPSA